MDRLSIKWKSDLSDKTKWEFFQAADIVVLLHGCKPWTLMKCFEKTLHENYTGMLCVKQILEKAAHKKSSKRLLAFNLTNHPRKTNRKCRALLELLNSFLQWTPTCGYTSVGQPTITYIYKLSANTRYSGPTKRDD